MLQERRNVILDKIMRVGMVKIADLALEFDVSIETIRRDLEYLEKHGYVKRVYGGAVSSKTYGKEPAYESREVSNYADKMAIAAKIIELLEDGSVVYLDVGTTVLEVARLLYTRKDITVVTNATKAAQAVISGKNNRVILLGGTMRSGEMSVSGSMTEKEAALFRYNTAVLGVGGLTPDGLTDYHVEEASVRRTVIERADRIIVAADHSKFGQTCMNFICPTSKISTIVTDPQTPQATLDEYQTMGISVIPADSSGS